MGVVLVYNVNENLKKLPLKVYNVHFSHTNWYHLMPISIRRHHWSSASILRASILDIAPSSPNHRGILVRCTCCTASTSLRWRAVTSKSDFLCSAWQHEWWHFGGWCHKCFRLMSGYESQGRQTPRLPWRPGPEPWWLMAYPPCSPKLVPLSSANSSWTLRMLLHLQLSPIWEQEALAVQQGERHRQQNSDQWK